MIVLSAVGLLWADAPKPPIVPEALKTEFFQAQANMIAANAQAQENRQVFNEAYKKLNEACGKDMQWSQTDGPKNGWDCTATPKHEAGKTEPKRP
jgi:hypothetical protein